MAAIEPVKRQFARRLLDNMTRLGGMPVENHLNFAKLSRLMTDRETSQNESSLYRQILRKSAELKNGGRELIFAVSAMLKELEASDTIRQELEKDMLVLRGSVDAATAKIADALTAITLLQKDKDQLAEQLKRAAISAIEFTEIRNLNDFQIIGKDFAIIGDKGPVRTNMEDFAGYAKIGDTEIYVVCDGMGGHGGGEVASKIAMEKYIDARKAGFTIIDSIKYTVDEMDDAVKNGSGEQFMGTTFVALEVDKENKEIRVINIGDSRAKMIDAQEAFMLTRDMHYKTEHYIGAVEKGADVFSQAALSENDIAEFDAFFIPPNANLITSQIGAFPNPKGGVNLPARVDILTIPIIESLDRTAVILATDGLISGSLKEQQVSEIVRRGGSAEKISNKLVMAAIASQTPDNVTVAAVLLSYKPDIEQAESVSYMADNEKKEMVKFDPVQWAMDVRRKAVEEKERAAEALKKRMEEAQVDGNITQKVIRLKHDIIRLRKERLLGKMHTFKLEFFSAGNVTQDFIDKLDASPFKDILNAGAKPEIVVELDDKEKALEIEVYFAKSFEFASVIRRLEDLKAAVKGMKRPIKRKLFVLVDEADPKLPFRLFVDELPDQLKTLFQ